MIYSSRVVCSLCELRYFSSLLKAFVEFIKSDSRLARAIVAKDWLSFARAYNGPAQSGYNTKMRDHYNDFKLEI